VLYIIGGGTQRATTTAQHAERREMQYPQILIDAVNASRNSYSSLGDYSSTQLIDPPRKVALAKRHGHEVTPDIRTQSASFNGTAIHAHYERMLRQSLKSDEYRLEQSVCVPVDIHAESIKWDYRLVSGTFDILHKEKHLYDLKACKVWKLTFDPDMKDWHEQQNIYAWLLRERGILVETINIIAIYMDWIESSALRDRKYPQQPIVVYPLRLWEPERQDTYVKDRLEKHVACESIADDDLPACTREERWERFQNGGTVQYALMKQPKARRAMKVENTLEDIIKAANSMKVTGESFIEVRYAARKRCDKYCSINEFCNHYRGYAEAKTNNTLNDIIPIGEVR
jgi:hypothetical protein